MSDQKRRIAGRSVICVIPRRRSSDFLKKLLPGYTLLAASSLTALRKLARREACDLYVVHSPLGWDEPDAVCRNIRSYDAHTPVVVYALQPSAGERREVAAAGAQAYVARSDDAHNLQGRAGQLIMLAELRSMEAMKSNAQSMQERIAGGLAQVARAVSGDGAGAPGRADARLKLQAARLFTQAGGTRANFERLWPRIYESALSTLSKGRT